MPDINQEIATRLRGIRELSDYTAEQLAEELSVSPELITAYESGKQDIPVGFLHRVSEIFRISITELLTGEAARLSVYCVARRGGGVGIERRAAYEYKSLAFNFADRKLDPYLITIPYKPEEEPFSLNAHSGQEYHYCLEGAFQIQIDNHILTINEGDSILFDSTHPHGMKALNGQNAKELVIITASQKGGETTTCL